MASIEKGAKSATGHPDWGARHASHDGYCMMAFAGAKLAPNSSGTDWTGRVGLDGDSIGLDGSGLTDWMALAGRDNGIGWGM